MRPFIILSIISIKWGAIPFVRIKIKVNILININGNIYLDIFKTQLFINVEFNKDSDGKILAELHYDRNHKLMRKYSAEYNSNGEISKIHVEDVPNFASWDIIPIRVTKTKEQAFSIRY